MQKRSTCSQKNSGSDLFDLSIIRAAIVFDTLGYLGYTLARTGNMMILSGCIAALGGIASPTLQSAMTKHVPPEQTGQLLGASGLLHALSRVVAPTLFNGIYAATVGSFTQTVFVCLTATFGLAFVISWLVKPHGKLLVTTLQSCSRVLIAIQSISTKTTLSIPSIRIEQFPRPIYRLGRAFLSFRALDTLMLRLCLLISLTLSLSLPFPCISLHCTHHIAGWVRRTLGVCT